MLICRQACHGRSRKGVGMNCFWDAVATDAGVMNVVMVNNSLKKMIWSRYNHIVKSKEYGYLLYNAMSGALLQIDEGDIGMFRDLQRNPDAIEEYSNSDFLLKSQIVLDKQTEEDNLNNHINEILVRRYNPSHMSLTIAVTRACNFNCVYCYETSRPNVFMTKDVEESVLNFVKQNESLRYLHVVWYGGEPLLNLDTIRRLTREFQKLDVKYTAQIVTNGYLMTSAVSKEFCDLDIRTVQVTLDGVSDIHNKRRPLKNGDGTYDRILENTQALLKNVPDVELYIRSNVDRDNIDMYPLFHNEIISRFGSDPRIRPYEGFVNDVIESGCSPSDKNIMDPEDRVDYIINHYCSAGVEHTFLPIRRHQTCIANNMYCYLIDPVGDLYKCWISMQNKKYKIGNVSTKASFDSVMNARYLCGSDYIFSKKCRECSVMPICEGGCPMVRYFNKYEKKGKDMCITFKKESLRLLELYYEQWVAIPTKE